ncbi:MAG: hypothetical protein K9M81_06115 [Chthoniobacterales bacterium]|nr:hypothetical protein [Chthoniobacterales bacterium]
MRANKEVDCFTKAVQEARNSNPDQQRIQQYFKEAEDWKIKAKQLARIFHTDHLRKPGSQMDAALISKSFSGSMKHTAVVAIHHLPCLHQDSRRLATNQYEISGLDQACTIN